MLATVPKPKQPRATPTDPGLIQTAFRLPPDLLEGLDALVDKINQARPWPKMTRADVVRMVLAKTIQDPPEWLTGATTTSNGNSG